MGTTAIILVFKIWRAMKPAVIFYNIVLLLSHISAQWQAYLLAYLQVDKGPKYNFQKDLGLSDF